MDHITKHILSEYPNEACGITVGDEWLICENVANDKTKNFTIHPSQYFHELTEGTFTGVWHSHCINNQKRTMADPRWMTAADMKSWQKTAVPWHIFATEGENVSKPLTYDQKLPTAPLLDREYIWGIQDCYTLVIDYYKDKLSITLPNHPRDFGWWNGTGNLFEDLLAQTGFKEVPLSEARTGDGVLIRLAGTAKIGHCGVLDNGQLLHHLVGARSISQQVEQWLHQIAKVVRYFP